MYKVHNRTPIVHRLYTTRKRDICTIKARGIDIELGTQVTEKKT